MILGHGLPIDFHAQSGATRQVRHRRIDPQRLDQQIMFADEAAKDITWPSATGSGAAVMNIHGFEDAQVDFGTGAVEAELTSVGGLDAIRSIELPSY